MAGLIIVFIVVLFCFFIGQSMTYKNILFSPQFGLFGGFILSIGFCFFWANRWEVELSEETIKVLCVGFITFLFVSLSTHNIGRRIKIKKKKNVSFKEEIQTGKIELDTCLTNSKLIGFAVFQFLVIILLIYSLRRIGMRSISEAIFYLRRVSLAEGLASLVPGYLRRIRRLCVASGYIWTYVLIYQSLNNVNRYSIWLVINIFFSIINDALFGARTGMVSFAIASVVQFYFLYEAKGNWNEKIKVKSQIRVIVLAVALIWSFQAIGDLMGRLGTVDFSEYIAKYLSAKIKNLDTFVRQERYGTDIYTNQTFSFLLNYLSGKFGLPDLTRNVYLPYNFVNGYNLGNVYTTFYPFYYDNGIAGVVIYTALMAFIGEISFLKATFKNKKKYNEINIGIIIYSYMFFTFAFCFFSNKFYEMIFNEVFLESLVYWIAVKWFLNLRITGRKRVNL